MNLKPKSGIINKKINLSLSLFIFLGSLLVYGITQGRSLSFWDAGEYITCSSILGVPHPPGNPFYILLGKFITIFSGSMNHAFIVNFLSGIFSSFAVMFTYLFTVKFVTMFEDNQWYAYLAGLFSSFFMAFSFTFWNNAIEAEVYSGLAFFISIIVWLTMIYIEKNRDFSHQNILILIIYLFFLGFGVHQTSLQIAPAVLFVVLYPLFISHVKESKFWIRMVAYFVGLIFIYIIFKNIANILSIPPLPKYAFALSIFGLLYYHLKDKVSKRTWFFSLFVVLLALSTHIFLWVRSEIRPFINEGSPNNFRMFMDYVLRRQYGVTSFLERRANFWYQLNDQFFTYFKLQFFNVIDNPIFSFSQKALINAVGYIFVLFVGLLGIFRQLKKNKHSFWYFFSFFFMASIAMVYVINLSDKEVRERDYFFTTAYCFWTFWMGIGAISIVDFFKKYNKGFAVTISIILLFFPAFNLYSQFYIHNRSKSFVALDYGLNIINGLEENAIVFTNGDNDTFPVWYAQAVKDKYSIEHISKETNVYPTAKTKKILKSAMEYKKKNLFGIRPDVTIANMSLLNTPWYIHQLKDLEGVEINWSKTVIDSIKPMLINKELKLNAFSPNGDKVSINIPGNVQGNYTFLQVKDISTIQIVQSNFGKRPIYFAVTIPDYVYMKKNLKREGMVYRLVADSESTETDINKLEHNVNNIYSFRSILDSTIYKEKNVKRLIGNYANLYQELTIYFLNKKNYQKAYDYLCFGEKFLLTNEDAFVLQKVDLLMKMNREQEALLILDSAIERNYGNIEWLYKIVAFYAEYDYKQRAIDILYNIIYRDPSNERPYAFAYQMANYKNMEDEIIELFSRISKDIPENKNILSKLIDDLKLSKDLKKIN